MVPRSIAFKCWAACLGSQARRLRRLTSDRAARESRQAHGPAAGRGNDRKYIGRIEHAERLTAESATISGWIDDPAHRGPDVDPTLFALIVCYLYGRTEVLPEIRRWAGHRGHANRIDYADPADRPAFIEQLLAIRG